MCGIAGLLGSPNARSVDDLTTTVRRMAATLRHRGPDDSDTWVNVASGIALGHTRLAIIDLSPAGRQPMLSATGRYAVVFNGEIYNFQRIAGELSQAGVRFRGHSDTEVFLAAVENWGVDGTLERVVGMFAIALWDQQDRTLHLIRDRVGEKPLYYGWVGNDLAFASELKALRTLPGNRLEIDPDALGRFLRLGYIPAPMSIHRGVYKLPPGTILSLRGDPADVKPVFSPLVRPPDAARFHPRAYWSVEQAARRASEHAPPTAIEAVDELETLLRSVIRHQMIADVPLGAFLSGGIDSSTVVALMQAESAQPVRTFSIGFDEPGFNEAEHAKAVARHLKTEHTEMYVSAREALDVVPTIAHVYDEPFADSAQIPTILVSRLARRHVTVALSGDGGDELFAGYNRYRLAKGVFNLTSRLPRWWWRLVGTGLIRIGTERWDRILGTLGKISGNKVLRQPRLGSRFGKFAGALRADGLPEIYQYLVSFWSDPASAILEPSVGTAPWLGDRLAAGDDPVARMLGWDQNAYLPDDHLVRVDRASMSTALEVRTPLLDHRIVELSWRLPTAFKINNGVSKWVLREVLYRHVPRSLVERPKMGFSVPIEQWLRGSLRDWAEDLLSTERLARDGLLRPATIRRVWNHHLAGGIDTHHMLWAVLMFQSWLATTANPPVRTA